MKKRILFPKNKQQEFLENCLSSLNLSRIELAEKLQHPPKSLSNYYISGKSRIPYDLFLAICGLTNQNPDKILLKYGAKITNNGVITPRKVVGESRKSLHEINISYLTKNYNLDTGTVKFSRSDIKKNIILPPSITPLLAEEVGMHLGDGFLSDSKYEYRLKGNKKDEKEYYDSFVKKAFKTLYNLDVPIKEYETTYGFELYSRAIHQFKSQIIGLHKGRKDTITIPPLFKVNDVPILTSLLRGLFDTDGNVYFQSRYGYKNYYPTISIAQKSEKLIKEVYSILKMLGVNPSLYIHEEYSSITLYGYKSLKRYLDLIGFHNPKHINKIVRWKATYSNLWR